MKFGTFPFVLFLSMQQPALVAVASAAPMCPSPQAASNMVPTFTSELTHVLKLDSRQWTVFSGVSLGNSDIEAQAYVPSAVAVIPNIGLRLSTMPGEIMGKAFKSGAVTTKERFAQTYGHFEMMAKLPETNGMWPAFWLLPENGTWPPEIDILEYIYAPNGVRPAASASARNFWIASSPSTTLHWKGVDGSHQQTSPMIGNTMAPLRTHEDWNQKPAPVGWGQAFVGYHIYAVDWRPGSVNWLVDGKPIFCVKDTPETGKRVPDVPMYMIINDAVTSGNSSSPGWAGFVESNTTWPQYLDIAYVRVFRFKDLPSVSLTP